MEGPLVLAEVFQPVLVVVLRRVREGVCPLALAGDYQLVHAEVFQQVLVGDYQLDLAEACPRVQAEVCPLALAEVYQQGLVEVALRVLQATTIAVIDRPTRSLLNI